MLEPNDIVIRYGYKTKVIRLGIGAIVAGLVLLQALALACYFVFGS